MKKILGSFFFIVITLGSLSAQENKGKYTLDFNLDPAALFDADAGSMFYMPGIKGRYFLASDMAARLGIFTAFSNNKMYNDATGDDYTKSSSAYITISPGIEKGFGTEKFVGYVGAELPVTSHTNKTEMKVGNNTTVNKNPNGNGYLGIGLDAVFGFDYYLFGNVYIGAEFSPGFMFYNYYDTSVDDIVTVKGGSGLDFYLSSSSGIRLGIRF